MFATCGILPEEVAVTQLGVYDEPQSSGAVVAVHWGDHRLLEIWVRSGANIGNWYCLGGEFGRPKRWVDPRSEFDKLAWPYAVPRPGPGEVPLHPHWEDVLARGPVTLLMPGSREVYETGWANGRRYLHDQMAEYVDEQPPESFCSALQEPGQVQTPPSAPDPAQERSETQEADPS